MPKVAIRDIDVDPTVQIRRTNHEPTIRRYEESFDKLPAVDVFKTPEGLLLADGFHRVAAAQRLGKNEVEANLHRGSREEALEFAVIANTKNADPLSPEERDDGIRRLKQLHPDWRLRQIADAMSVSQQTVKRVFEIDEVRRAVVAPVTRVTSSHYGEVASAPREQWEPLLKAADKRGWSRDATRLAIKNLKDDRIPEDRRNAILKGKADPVVVTPEGQFAVPAEVVGRQIKEMASNDAVLALERALEALAKLRLFRADAIVGTVGRPRLDRLVEEMPGYIEFMEEVVEAARNQSRKMEAVK